MFFNIVVQTKQLLFKAISKIQYKKKQITKRSYYNYCYIYVTLLVTMLPSIGEKKNRTTRYERENANALFFNSLILFGTNEF